jgi:pimeloyl-ACP methyl ester carboxylesterase
MRWLRTVNPLFVLFTSSWVSAIDAPDPRTFDSNGVSISYTVEGKGEPVVLIHGLFVNADLNWRLPGVIRTLAENHQVIAMDARGHGLSGKPETEGSYGPEMAEDVVRLLDHLKIKKADVVGYSMGGMIAMKLATVHPDRVRSVVLGGMGWEQAGGHLAEFWSSLPKREGSQPPSACVRSLGQLAVKDEEVKAIKIPTIVLVGEHDPVRRLAVAPLEKVRPDWPVKIIDGAGHINCVNKTQFKEALKKWLDEQPGNKD